ncbi:SpoIIE family protein phosphatase [Streptomyces sp. NPDC048254]|uniref:SpoIIE family protein phosphatase n=1 Tax=Streptomyces sp. NPDC048254 TaxID=3365525 RepID=UPI003722AECC
MSPAAEHAITAGPDEDELLRLGIASAVAVLHGLGGMIHRDPMDSGPMLLAAHTGLSDSFVRAWEDVGRGEAVAPARAVLTRSFAWMPAHGDRDPRVGSDRLPVGTGLASVPVLTRGGRTGVLSVLTSASQEPDAEERRVLHAVARCIGDRLCAVRTAKSAAESGRRRDGGSSQIRRGPEFGIWDWDFTSDTVTLDASAVRILGCDTDTLDGRTGTWQRLVHPEDLQRVLAWAAQARGGPSAYSVEFRIRRHDGDFRWVTWRSRDRGDRNGGGARLSGTVRDATDSRLTRDFIDHALRQASDGVLALDGSWRVASSSGGAEHLLGLPEQLPGRCLWEAVPDLRTLGVEEAARRAVADGEPLGLDIPWSTHQRWLRIRLVPVADGLTVYLSDITGIRRHAAEQVPVDAAVGWATTPIVALTRALAAAVTGHDVVNTVNEYMLPLVGATGVGVWVLEAGRVFLVAAVGVRQEVIERVEAVPVENLPEVAQALLDGVPNFISSPEELIRRYPGMTDIVALSGKQAWAHLPLIVSGRRIGVCVITYDRPQVFRREEQTLITALSGLVAQAMERARLYDAEHTRAQELQRGLLPRVLPSVPAVTAAARYLPAGTDMEVGGDWYDVIPLSADRVALVIGDVMGHGLSEAATMGRLRTAVRTLADLEMPPDELFSHLDETVVGLGEDFYATCLYAVYDPADRRCSVITAGHPPPAVVPPDGAAYFLDLPCNPPLGVAAPPLDMAEMTLPEDSLLVLYTDGLVESAGRDIDEGMARLRRRLGTGYDGAPGLDGLCDDLIAEMLPDPYRISDDAALLVARTHALAPQDIACWQLPDEPMAAGQARHSVRKQLAAWALDELSMTTELLVSELVGNVVRHASGPITIRLLRSRTLICEVSDGSLSMPRIRRAADTDEGGRGLQLVAAMADRWGARYTPSGKCIWTEQALPTDR